jgi:hypothetical protein
MAFSAKVSKDYSGGYKWSVSAGNIESNRTNYWISVRVPGDTDTPSITATVELDGIAAGCPSTGSETGYVDIGGDIFPVDVYGSLRRRDEIARLAIISDHLSKNAGSIAIIIIRTPKKNASAIYTSRVRTVGSIFRTLRVNKDRIVTVNGGVKELETVIYVVPKEIVPYFCKP